MLEENQSPRAYSLLNLLEWRAAIFCCTLIHRTFELPGAGQVTQMVLTSEISLLKGRPEALDIPFRKEEESDIGVVGGIGKYDQ